MATKLSPHQIAQAAFDEASSSIKTSLQNVEISIELDHADGDSVTAYPVSTQSEITLAAAQNQDAIAIAPESIAGCRVISLFASNAGSSTTLAIDVSPSDTGDLWVEIGELVAATGNTYASPSLPAARRARVRFKTVFAGDGIISIYLNGRS